MKLLLIEDEPELARNITDYFSGNGFRCEWVSTLSDAKEKIGMYNYDCILLDLMLPDGDGLKALKHVKSEQKEDGVIIISAKNGLENKLEGLETGADDYLTKPFHLSELMARVQAIIRRKQFNGNNQVSFEEITINLSAHTVTVNKNTLSLTRSEFNLLLYLIGNKNRVLSKNAIAEHLSGDMADLMVNHDFVYAHIKNLKKKLVDAGTGDYIKSVYGLGYKWQA
jgi:DNA-binding response OmpR family regulator